MRAMLLLVFLVGFVPRAVAQPDGDATSASKVTLARRLYEEGVDAVGKGRWSVAHDRFKASYELSPRVLTLFNYAGAQRETSRFVEASESYRRFVRETADGRYADLRNEALSALEAIEKQIAQLKIEVTNLEPTDAIAIDDAEFPRAALGEPMPMNPGAHVISIRRDGAPLSSKTITLAAGVAETAKIELPRREARVANLQLRGAPEASVVSTGPRDQSERPAKRGVLKSPWFWTGVVLVVAGGATAAYLLTRPDDGVLVVR